MKVPPPSNGISNKGKILQGCQRACTWTIQTGLYCRTRAPCPPVFPLNLILLLLILASARRRAKSIPSWARTTAAKAQKYITKTIMGLQRTKATSTRRPLPCVGIDPETLLGNLKSGNNSSEPSGNSLNPVFNGSVNFIFVRINLARVLTMAPWDVF